jgi:hypothetical protein
MDESQIRPCEARQPCTDIGRMCRYWFSVDSNENFLEDHGNLLAQRGQANYAFN